MRFQGISTRKRISKNISELIKCISVIKGCMYQLIYEIIWLIWNFIYLINHLILFNYYEITFFLGAFLNNIFESKNSTYYCNLISNNYAYTGFHEYVRTVYKQNQDFYLVIMLFILEGFILLYSFFGRGWKKYKNWFN